MLNSGAKRLMHRPYKYTPKLHMSKTYELPEYGQQPGAETCQSINLQINNVVQ